jgi:hypothetical protein
MARRAVIASKQYRAENDVLRFWLSEGAYSKEVPRRYSRETTVDGTLLSDYGLHEGDRVITAGRIKLSESELNTLRYMQADNTNDYTFSDGVNLWEVILRSIIVDGRGSHSVVAVTMDVIEKVI